LSQYQLPTILVVENEPDPSRRLEVSLDRIGFEGVSVTSGEQALAWLDDQNLGDRKPILALVDLHLEGRLSGVTLGQRLGSIYQVPFFFLARQASEIQNQRVLRSQPFGYLILPCEDDELRSTLTLANEALGEREREKAIKNPVVTPTTDEEAILVTDLMGHITYLNPLGEELTGWQLAEARGQNYQEIFRIIDEKGRPQPHEPFSGTGKCPEATVWLLPKEGAPRLLDERSSTLTDANGSLAGLFIAFGPHKTSQDAPTQVTLSESPAYEEHGSEQRMAAVVEAISDPLFAMDNSWNVTYVNQKAEEHLGRPSKALLGRNFWNEFPESVHAKYYHEYYKAASSQEPRDFEFYHEIQGRWIEVHAYPFTKGLLVLIRDITARRRAQERASKLEKLESLGLLARGFAHDFNNLLTVLLGNVSLARYSLPGEQGYYQSLDAAKQATEQARNLVQQLLTFAKGGVPITDSVDLNSEIIGEIMRHRNRQAHIDYQFEHTKETVYVEADHEQLERLLENLMENAEQAMLGGGTLRITSKTLTATDPMRRELSANLDAHTEYVMLEVHDTGEGIAQANIDKIFEPYFSTRTDANATGLGLTVCDSIARSHKGFLTIDSRPGNHTTARLFLPTCRQQWQALQEETPEITLKRQRPVNDPPRVLILDDERPIRLIMSISLKKDGYEVVETEEGSQTVEAYQTALTQGQRFDLVITDLSIPNGMGGAEAMQQIRFADPDVVAVVSSGYSDDPVMANYTQFGFSAVLPKPYKPSTLRQLAHRLIKGEQLAID